MSDCGSAALEGTVFTSTYSSCKCVSLKVVCLRPTASSATLWGTSSSAPCWRGLASAAICPNCTLFSRCQAHTWERCTTTAHWSAQVRPPVRCTLQRCCTTLNLDVLCTSAAFEVSSNDVIHMLRVVVDAKAEEIRILAAAHLQGSRWSTQNIPLSSESETRYRLKKNKLIN